MAYIKGTCRACKTRERVLLHHTHYEKYGARKDKTVMLCESCHNMLHTFIKGNDPDLPVFTMNFIKGGKFWK